MVVFLIVKMRGKNLSPKHYHRYQSHEHMHITFSSLLKSIIVEVQQNIWSPKKVCHLKGTGRVILENHICRIDMYGRMIWLSGCFRVEFSIYFKQSEGSHLIYFIPLPPDTTYLIWFFRKLLKFVGNHLYGLVVRPYSSFQSIMESSGN